MTQEVDRPAPPNTELTLDGYARLKLSSVAQQLTSHAFGAVPTYVSRSPSQSAPNTEQAREVMHLADQVQMMALVCIRLRGVKLEQLVSLDARVLMTDVQLLVDQFAADLTYGTSDDAVLTQPFEVADILDSFATGHHFDDDELPLTTKPVSASLFGSNHLDDLARTIEATFPLILKSETIGGFKPKELMRYLAPFRARFSLGAVYADDTERSVESRSILDTRGYALLARSETAKDLTVLSRQLLRRDLDDRQMITTLERSIGVRKRASALVVRSVLADVASGASWGQVTSALGRAPTESQAVKNAYQPAVDGLQERALIAILIHYGLEPRQPLSPLFARWTALANELDTWVINGRGCDDLGVPPEASVVADALLPTDQARKKDLSQRVRLVGEHLATDAVPIGVAPLEAQLLHAELRNAAFDLTPHGPNGPRKRAQGWDR